MSKSYTDKAKHQRKVSRRELIKFLEEREEELRNNPEMCAQFLKRGERQRAKLNKAKGNW